MAFDGGRGMGERMRSVAFWIAVGILAWLGLRHLFSILVGCSRDGPLKPGQRLCHATSLLLLIGSSILAVIFDIWWALLAGVVSEYLFRRLVIWSGEKFPVSEEENRMSGKEFKGHIFKKGRDDKT